MDSVQLRWLYDPFFRLESPRRAGSTNRDVILVSMVCVRYHPFFASCVHADEVEIIISHNAVGVYFTA